MSALSNADKIRLAALNERALALPWNPSKGGAAFADQFRRALPDVDDVTIGRVLLEMGQFIGQLAPPRRPPAEQPLRPDHVRRSGLDRHRVAGDAVVNTDPNRNLHRTGWACTCTATFPDYRAYIGHVSGRGLFFGNTNPACGLPTSDETTTATTPKEAAA